jgi:hypothetical protein
MNSPSQIHFVRRQFVVFRRKWTGFGNMNRQIWLASYPRSGNTFLRALLAAYRQGVNFNINRLGENSAGEHNEVVWRLVTGLPADVRSFLLEWRHRRQYFDLLRTYENPHRLQTIKTHTANVAVAGIPAFHFKPDDRVIFIVRHPGDVAISLSKYAGLTIDQALANMTDHAACAPPSLQTRAEFRGSWAAHTESWLNEKSIPVLAIQYRDLVTDAASQLINALTFLDINIDMDKVAFAVNATRFNELCKQEKDLGFDENLNHAEPFFRSGQDGQWKGLLTDQQMFRLAYGNEALMDRLRFEYIR